MDLSAGAYRVSAGPDDRIRVEWTVRHQHELRDVEADVEVDGPRNGFHVDIEVPRRADLFGSRRAASSARSTGGGPGSSS